MIPRRAFLLSGAAVLLPRLGRPGPTRCIRIRLTGGPSQIDTFDPKPDAPSGVRGPFRPILTSVPGVYVSELFPLTARQARRFTLVRSVYSTTAPAHPAPLPSLVAARAHADLGRYGRTRFGAECLAARCAVEAGAVETGAVETGAKEIGAKEIAIDMPGWDTHGWSPFSTMRDLRDTVAPAFDRAYSALLEDLDERGLLATTLVIAAGEFGRTPKLNPDGGRDHWSRCQTVLLAGGGIRGGQVYGSSDSIGAEPRDNPVALASIENPGTLISELQ